MASNKKTPVYKGRELARATGGVDGDLLAVLLEPDKLYTQKQAEEILNNAKGREVKTDAGR